MFGTIPQTIHRLSNLTDLFLYNNGLHSPLPSGLFELEKLRVLSIFDNHFDGSMPSDIGLLSDLEFLVLSHNSFTGIVPEHIGNLTSIRESFEHNGVYHFSHLLSPFCHQEEIYLDHNNFTGVIPQPICDLRQDNIFTIGINATNTVSSSNVLQVLRADCLSKVECQYPECCTECF